MAKNRKDEQNSSQSSSTPQPAMLAYYADRMVWEDTGNAELKARELIDWALTNGQDNFLKQALDLVSTEAGWEELWSTITFLASVAYYGVIGHEGAVFCAELFAVPIIFLPLDAASQPCVPLDVPDFDWLVTSLREYGLDNPVNERLSLTGHLWSLDELNSAGFSPARDMANLLIDHLLEPDKHHEALILSDMPFKKVPIQENSSGLFLRFLVGIMMYPANINLPFLCDENNERIAKWTEVASERLSRALNSNVLVLALAPDNFYTAQLAAVAEFRMAAIILQVDVALDRAGLTPEAVQAVISAHGKSEAVSELRIALYAPDAPEKQLLGQVWELTQFEGAVEVAERIKDALDERGIKSEVAIEDILPLDSDSRAGSPRYARPPITASVIAINRGSGRPRH